MRDLTSKDLRKAGNPLGVSLPPRPLEELVARTKESFEQAACRREFVPALHAQVRELRERTGGGGAFSAMEPAVADCLHFLNDLVPQDGDPASYRDALNLPLRGRWIEKEHELCSGKRSAEQEVRALRWLLRSEKGKAPLLPLLHYDFRRALENEGGRRFLDSQEATAAGREFFSGQHQGNVCPWLISGLSEDQRASISFRRVRPELDRLRLSHDLEIRAYSAWLPPSPEILQSLEEVNRELLIDPKKKKPQEGIGMLLSAATMREWWLSSPTSHIFVMLLDGETAGYLTLFPGKEGWPESGRTALPHAQRHIGMWMPAWFEMVGIRHGPREVFKSFGLSGYELLLGAALDAAIDMNHDMLLCMVREGPAANTAKAKHLREGFREPHIQFDFHGTPYSILYADLEEAIDRRILDLALSPGGADLLMRIRSNARKRE